MGSAEGEHGSSSNGSSSNGSSNGSGPGGPVAGDGPAPRASPWAAPAWNPAPEPAAASGAEWAAPVPGGPPPPPMPPPPMPLPQAPSESGAPYPVPGSPPLPAPADAIPGAPTTGWASPPPEPRTHRWGLGAFLLVVGVFLLTSVVLGEFVDRAQPPSAGSLALLLSVPTVVAAGTALLITRLRGNGPFADLRLRWSWRDAGLGLAFGAGGLVVTFPASVLYSVIVGPDATSAVGEVFGNVRAAPLLAVGIFVVVVFLAPLCEEIVYRGLLWGAVERLGAGRWITLGVTTLVFSLAHFEPTRTPLLLVVALPIGLARMYTGNLLASVVAHQVNNLLPGIALLLGLVGVLPVS